MSKQDRKPHPLRKSGKQVEHKNQLRLEAENRQLQYNALTTEEKIAKLNSKFGVDLGATKQRVRLFKELANCSPDDGTIMEAIDG